MKFLVRFLVVGLGLTAATFLRAADEPVGPPNIVFIAIDDLNDWVGCLGGNPDVKTPHMDRLAERGLLFTNAHCQVPVCMGSRVSVFSGKLASTTGCYEFNAEFHQAPTLANDLPIPLLFKRQGYHTLG
ncbi:MAG: sulfatase-like hydrolase/transferase, partial [Verrucomicrobiae bacterium]|nr:sulfatase-like hydrolase/transferase [Verrucomicrobiae bacterium]